MMSIKRMKIVKRLRDPRTRKCRHAIAFIQYLVGMLSDTEPTNGMKVLPFRNVNQLYEEYQQHCDKPLNKSKITASRAIFFEAFDGLKDTVKLVGGVKGSFGTCNICNSAKLELGSYFVVDGMSAYLGNIP